MTIEEKIKQKAIELGFNLVGITDAGSISQPEIDRLNSWIESGCAAQMEYLKRNIDKRVNPSRLLDEAASIISLAMSYATGTQHAPDNDEYYGRIADYALCDDYHFVIKEKLYKLADFIVDLTKNSRIRFKFCVDSVPIAEKSIARKAGLGFIGKNTMLINPSLGSRFFLAEIITTLHLKADELQIDDPGTCQNCRLCIEACPTGALNEEGYIDANKCISYFTIEHKGDIPQEISAEISDNIYGCDRCVSICPYNTAHTPACTSLNDQPQNKHVKILDILRMDEKEFQQSFARSAIKRLGLERLKRNAQICLKNQINHGARKTSLL